MDQSIPLVSIYTGLMPSLREISHSIKDSIDHNNAIILRNVVSMYIPHHMYVTDRYMVEQYSTNIYVIISDICAKAMRAEDTESVRVLATIYSEYLPIYWDGLAYILLYKWYQPDHIDEDSIVLMAKYILPHVRDGIYMALSEDIIDQPKDVSPLDIKKNTISNVPIENTYTYTLGKLLRDGRIKCYIATATHNNITDTYLRIDDLYDIPNICIRAAVEYDEENGTEIIDPDIAYLVRMILDDDIDKLMIWLTAVMSPMYRPGVDIGNIVAVVVSIFGYIKCYDRTYTKLPYYRYIGIMETGLVHYLVAINAFTWLVRKHLELYDGSTELEAIYRNPYTYDHITTIAEKVVGKPHRKYLLSMALKLGFVSIIDKYLLRMDLPYLMKIDVPTIIHIVRYVNERRPGLCMT